MHDESATGTWRFVFANAGLRLPHIVSRAQTAATFFEEAMRGRWFGSLMVTPGRSTDARIAVPLARRYGIPTLDVQAGTVSASRRYRPPIADRVTAIDRVHREMFRDYFKVPESAIEVVGAPRIDRHLAAVRAMSRAERRAAPSSPSVASPIPAGCSCSPRSPSSGRSWRPIVRVVFGALEGLCPVLVKPHPKEPPENLAFYESVAREEFGRTRVIVAPAADVYRAIVAADGVATYFSTIALEAFALKRPVYVIDPFDAPPALDFAAAGLGARIRTAAELRAGMTAVLAGEACRGTIRDDPHFSVLQDGRSAERIVAILERMIGEAAMPSAA